MSKKISSFILALILLVSAFAAGSAAAAGYDYILDEEGVLSGSQLEKLNDTANNIYRQTGVDVILKLTSGLEGDDIIAYSEEIDGLGSGSENCIVLAIGLEWYVYYTGSVGEFMNDDIEQELFDAYFEEETYAGGIDAYLRKANELILNNLDIESAPTDVTGTDEDPDGKRSRLVDFAGLLTQEEFESLEDLLDSVSKNKKIDIVICTVDSTDGKSVEAYADDMFDYAGYGYGADRDGVLLLISMEGRDWHVSTHGFGKKAFSVSKIQDIGGQIRGDLSSGKYFSAFYTFVELCGETIDNARSGAGPLSLLWIPISLVIGFIIALIVVGAMKSKLKTVRSQAAANCYVVPGSMVVTDNLDLFLYSSVTRTERPKEKDDSGSHTSSSGAEHGGSGGKF